MIYEVINVSIPSLLNPKLTASWEKGLKLVYEKSIEPEEFMLKLEAYTRKSTYTVFKDNKLALLNRKLLEVKNVYNN